MWKKIVLLAVLTGLVVALPALAEARLLKSAKADVALQPPANGKSPSDAMPRVEGAPLIVSSAPCCPKRCIEYRHHRGKKVCCGCEPPIQLMLAVKDPCVCDCFVDVAICLPACCTDVPKVCNRRGLLGRDVVEYEWCCGYRVRVVFDRHGDVMVHSYGS